MRYFKSVGLTFSLIVLIGTIGNQAFSIYSNTWLSDWADDPTSIEPSRRDLYLGVYGALGIAQGTNRILFSVKLFDCSIEMR